MIKSYNEDKSYFFTHFHNADELLIDVKGHEYVTLLCKNDQVNNGGKWMLKIIRPNTPTSVTCMDDYEYLLNEYKKAV